MTAERSRLPLLLVNTLERQERNDQIVEFVSRGVPPATVARTLGITRETVYTVLRQFRASNPTLRQHDPIEIIDQMLEGYQADLAELAVIASTTKNESVRVGAIRSRAEMRDRILGLMQATGVLPHELGKLRVQHDVRFVADRLVDLFERYGLPDEAQEEVIALLSPGDDVVEGTAS